MAKRKVKEKATAIIFQTETMSSHQQTWRKNASLDLDFKSFATLGTVGTILLPTTNGQAWMAVNRSSQ